MRKTSIIIAGILAIALLMGCQRLTPPDIPPADTLPADGQGGPAVDLPAPGEDNADTPGIAEFGAAGKILSIKESDTKDVLGIIEVKGEKDTGQMYDYAMVTITPDTKIDVDGPASFSDLTEGMQVTVFFDGAVAESYPVQGKARQVVAVIQSGDVSKPGE